MNNYITLGPDTPLGLYVGSNGILEGQTIRLLEITDDESAEYEGAGIWGFIPFGTLLRSLEPVTPFVPKVGDVYCFPEYVNYSHRFETATGTVNAQWLVRELVLSGLCRRTPEECQTICNELNAVLDKHRIK
jgi:hypothetical protein